MENILDETDYILIHISEIWDGESAIRYDFEVLLFHLRTMMTIDAVFLYEHVLSLRVTFIFATHTLTFRLGALSLAINL